MALTADSDISSFRSPTSHRFGKILRRRLAEKYSTGSSGKLQLLNPTTSHVREYHSQRPRRLLLLRKQKRSCNTATCVTHRLASFLSRSGGLSRNFIPTDVGAKAFGRKRRGARV
ncbi:hypothetical protein scyTo_0021813 [Scyliorhinus torazame]|uniref:Calcitonin peptide-like domain-containing protein n=1 Tax=Scyliorhinus torazame TaxID=75743 RepID=A0A401Q7D9_SCYTO|nr:hypothetical protein [Scyliorhinus torazame]